MQKHYFSALALLVMVALAAGSIDTSKQRPASKSNVSSAQKWYAGGTLHDKSALEWQKASNRDKLATCADFVSSMWKSGKLKSSVSRNLTTVDDVRPYAQELVNFLNAAFKQEADPKLNRQLYTNQTVSGSAAIGMVMMEWMQ